MRLGLIQLRAVVTKELRQTLRDRRMMALLLAAPAIQLVLLGFAVNLDVDRVPTLVVDQDQSRLSREHTRRLLADGTLEEIGREPQVALAEARMDLGEAAVILVLPEGYERDLVRGRTARLQSVVDGSDPNRSNVAAAAVAEYAGLENVARVQAALDRRPGMPRTATPVTVRSRVWFNPALSTAVFMVPGVAGVLLMLITTVIAAMGLARERESGTLEQILVTPVPSWVLIAGKILPFALFGIFDFALALAAGAYVFGMPLRGSMLLLFFVTGLYLLTTLGVGLLISTSSSSQQQAFLGGFFFMLPSALLSGVFTPVRSMPAWMQPLTLANPMRHYAEVLRGVLLRGAGADDLGRPILILAAFGAVVFTASVLRFRKTNG